MEPLDFLNKLIQDRFIANSTIEAIERKIENDISSKIFEIYKSKKISYENLEFELLGVITICNSHFKSMTLDKKIRVELNYICVSKLQKDKQQKVEKAIESYKKSKFFGYNNLKVQLWHTFYYELDLKTCIESENIPLRFVFH